MIDMEYKSNVSESTDPNNLVSNSVLLIFNYVTLTVLCQGTAVFGVGTNIINMACFIKEGFKDPFNVSLMGLAISDLGCLLTVIWTNICFTPAFSTLDLPFDPIEVTYITGGIPHTTFTRITGWITAMISLERCLCIVAPLKVKTIVSSNKAILFVSSIFAILIASVSPMYAIYSLDLRFFPDRNKTILGLAFSSNRESIEKISFLINNVFIPFSAFLVIITCTITMAVKLRRTTKWRKTIVASGQAENTAIRNQKVAKMVVIISTLFIICYVPLSVIFIAMSLDSRFAFDGKLRNLVIMLGGLGFLMESINSSVNIFVYYRMSCRFRAAFLVLFCVGGDRSKNM